jgi:hypothetical protein
MFNAKRKHTCATTPTSEGGGGGGRKPIKFCNRQYERALTRVICKSLRRVTDAVPRGSVCLLTDTRIYRDEVWWKGRQRCLRNVASKHVTFLDIKKIKIKKGRRGRRKKERKPWKYSRNASGIPRTLPCCLFILPFFQVRCYCYHLWDSVLRQSVSQSLLSSCRHVYSERLLFMKLTYRIWAAKSLGSWRWKLELQMNIDSTFRHKDADRHSGGRGGGSDVCNCAPCHQIHD